METIEGIVKNGHVVPTADIELPEGSKAIITIVDSENDEFWLSTSEEAAARVWGNSEDDVYAELLKK
jgi:hypothetical protein